MRLLIKVNRRRVTDKRCWCVLILHFALNHSNARMSSATNRRTVAENARDAACLRQAGTPVFYTRGPNRGVVRNRALRLRLSRRGPLRARHPPCLGLRYITNCAGANQKAGANHRGAGGIARCHTLSHGPSVEANSKNARHRSLRSPAAGEPCLRPAGSEQARRARSHTVTRKACQCVNRPSGAPTLIRVVGGTRH